MGVVYRAIANDLNRSVCRSGDDYNGGHIQIKVRISVVGCQIQIGAGAHIHTEAVVSSHGEFANLLTCCKMGQGAVSEPFVGRKIVHIHIRSLLPVGVHPVVVGFAGLKQATGNCITIDTQIGAQVDGVARIKNFHLVAGGSGNTVPGDGRCGAWVI